MTAAWKSLGQKQSGFLFLILITFMMTFSLVAENKCMTTTLEVEVLTEADAKSEFWNRYNQNLEKHKRPPTLLGKFYGTIDTVYRFVNDYFLNRSLKKTDSALDRPVPEAYIHVYELADSYIGELLKTEKPNETTLNKKREAILTTLAPLKDYKSKIAQQVVEDLNRRIEQRTIEKALADPKVRAKLKKARKTSFDVEPELEGSVYLPIPKLVLEIVENEGIMEFSLKLLSPEERSEKEQARNFIRYRSALTTKLTKLKNKKRKLKQQEIAMKMAQAKRIQEGRYLLESLSYWAEMFLLREGKNGENYQRIRLLMSDVVTELKESLYSESALNLVTANVRKGQAIVVSKDPLDSPKKWALFHEYFQQEFGVDFELGSTEKEDLDRTLKTLKKHGFEVPDIKEKTISFANKMKTLGTRWALRTVLTVLLSAGGVTSSGHLAGIPKEIIDQGTVTAKLIYEPARELWSRFVKDNKPRIHDLFERYGVKDFEGGVSSVNEYLTNVVGANDKKVQEGVLYYTRIYLEEVTKVKNLAVHKEIDKYEKERQEERRKIFLKNFYQSYGVDIKGYEEMIEIGTAFVVPRTLVKEQSSNEERAKLQAERLKGAYQQLSKIDVWFAKKYKILESDENLSAVQLRQMIRVFFLNLYLTESEISLIHGSETMEILRNKLTLKLLIEYDFGLHHLNWNEVQRRLLKIEYFVGSDENKSLKINNEKFAQDIMNFVGIIVASQANIQRLYSDRSFWSELEKTISEREEVDAFLWSVVRDIMGD